MESMNLFKSDIECEVLDYMETKSMSYNLIDYINKNGTTNKEVLFRGDCLYKSFIHVGQRFRLWNGFASFTSDNKVADKFANDMNVPDWYFEEKEWCGNHSYPFEEFISREEKLVPIIIVVCKNKIPKCFCTDGYSEKFNESEYIVLTEDIEFLITRIEDKYVYCDVLKIPHMHLYDR